MVGTLGKAKPHPTQANQLDMKNSFPALEGNQL